MGLTTFLFRDTCGNHIVWGAEEINTRIIRHTSGGPARFDSEAAPLLLNYVKSDPRPLVAGINAAKAATLPRDIGKPAPTIDNALEFAAKAAKFTRGEMRDAIEYAVREEGQCVSAWDLVQGLTASAREISFADARADLEKRAGRIMSMVAGKGEI